MTPAARRKVIERAEALEMATAVNAVWIGFERLRRGEGWAP